MALNPHEPNGYGKKMIRSIVFHSILLQASNCERIGALIPFLFVYLLHRVSLFNLGWYHTHPPQYSNSDMYHTTILVTLFTFCQVFFFFNQTLLFVKIMQYQHN